MIKFGVALNLCAIWFSLCFFLSRSYILCWFRWQHVSRNYSVSRFTSIILYDWCEFSVCSSYLFFAFCTLLFAYTPPIYCFFFPFNFSSFLIFIIFLSFFFPTYCFFDFITQFFLVRLPQSKVIYRQEGKKSLYFIIRCWRTVMPEKLYAECNSIYFA